jgi:hypothetical protein
MASSPLSGGAAERRIEQVNETPASPREHLSTRSPREVPESAPAAPLNELDDPQLLAILAQEHTGLLATRSLTWTESFSRAALFLSTLSAAVIVLGLVGPATHFGPEFFAFALIILPVALFVGVATFLRIDEGNRDDIFWVVGMNRIRQAYVRMRPAAAPFLILGTTDDLPGITQSFGALTGTYSVAHFFVTIPGMIAVIDAVLAGTIAGMAGTFTGASIAVLIAVGVAVGVVTGFLLARVSQRGVMRLIETQKPVFPSEASAAEGRA